MPKSPRKKPCPDPSPAEAGLLESVNGFIDQLKSGDTANLRITNIATLEPGEPLPPRVLITIEVPGSTTRLTSVHYTGPGTDLTLCRYEHEKGSCPVVGSQPTEEPLSCTACARRVQEAKSKPGYGSPEHLAAMQRGIDLAKIGVAGVTPRGVVVDRREDPTGLPIPANGMMDVPKPLKLGPKMPPGRPGLITAFSSDAADTIIEYGSDPGDGSDCGERGINHLMRSSATEWPRYRCFSPGCDFQYGEDLRA